MGRLESGVGVVVVLVVRGVRHHVTVSVAQGVVAPLPPAVVATVVRRRGVGGAQLRVGVVVGVHRRCGGQLDYLQQKHDCVKK